MKKTLMTSLLLASIATMAQRKDSLPSGQVKMPAEKSAVAGPSALGSKSSSNPKPYKDVITEKAITKKGLFTVHKVEDKYYFEIILKRYFKN